MSYATEDFAESFGRVPLTPSDVERVIAAWGEGNGQGAEECPTHMRWSENSPTDWSGGFLMLLKDGRFAYLTGWCDYTGWGCQDGARVDFFDAEPDLSTLTRFHDPEWVNYQPDPAPPAAEWDIEPADLNRWLASVATEA